MNRSKLMLNTMNVVWRLDADVLKVQLKISLKNKGSESFSWHGSPILVC